jgi:hypothetical protein
MSKISLQKIDEQIRKLQELKRFMSDPTTAPMIEQLISSNGEVSPQYAKLPIGKSTQRGALLKAVEIVCKTAPSDFTAKEVIRNLELQGYMIQAKDKAIAVNGALKRLLKRGVINVTSAGAGKRPSIYGFVKRFPREMKGTAA